MQWAERLYRRSPAWLQNLGLTVHGWRIRRHRFGRRCARQLDRLLEMERWPRERLRAFQDERVRRIVRHAYEESPFYRRRLDAAGIAPEDISGVSDLPALPLLSKEDVRQHADEMRTSSPRRGWLEGHTSGTTGSPLGIWYDRHTCVLTNAVDERHKRWAGMADGDWIGLFLGRVVVPTDSDSPPFWRVNRALRQVWFSSFHMSPENLPGMISEVERRGLRFLEGYPSTLFVLADFLRRSGRTLPMRSVITSSETLHPTQRETIEDAFECSLFDFYALAERVVYAGECEEHEGKHVAEEYGVIEIVDEDGRTVPAGRPGFVVGTSLHNRAMPMIRYRTSDVSAVLAGSCRCGRTLVRMRDVATKAEDIVVTPDGRWISPSVLTHPFKPLEQVLKSQIIQDAVDHIIVKILPAGRLSEAEEGRLRNSLRARLGDRMRIDVEVVDDIPREPSGKFRWVISRVEHDLKVTWT